VEHQRVVVVQRPAFPLGVDRMQADRVLVVGDDVVDLEREGATLYASELEHNLTHARAAKIEDQNDRLLRCLHAAQAERTQAAVAVARPLERDLTPAPAVDVVATQPSVRPVPAAPGAVVDVLAALLLGLVGGLVGGGAAIGGWILATRRRVRRVAAAT
jgi:hypothetical protein